MVSSRYCRSCRSPPHRSSTRSHRLAATLLFLSAANWAYTWLTHETSVDEVVEGFWKLLGDAISP
jgi:hypothetical protein